MKSIRYRRNLNYKLWGFSISGPCSGVSFFPCGGGEGFVLFLSSIWGECSLLFFLLTCLLLICCEWGLCITAEVECREIVKWLLSRGSIVARSELKEIDGVAHKKWNLRINLTQRGETYQVRTGEGLTVWMCFLDFLGGGAWPLVVGGLNRLVNFENERDQRMIFWTPHLWIWGLVMFCIFRSNLRGMDLNSLTRIVRFRKSLAITGLWCP